MSGRLSKRPPLEQLPYLRGLFANARTFSNVICNGSTLQPDYATEDDTMAFHQSFRSSWLHVDNLKLSDTRNDEESDYIFASPLHRWFVEWKFLDVVPTIPFESYSILQLAFDVIARFSARWLST